MRTANVIVCLLLPLLSFAQPDTAFTWLNSSHKITNRDSAVYLRKQYRSEGACKVQEFHLGTGKLTWDADFDASCKKKNGRLQWYSDSGVLQETSIYADDKKTEHHLYYPNGVKRMEAFLKDDEVLKVKGWDTNGNEIPNSIYQQQATFPGGVKAWKKYLTKAMQSGLPPAFKQGFMSGLVVVSFTVDPAGEVTDVKLDTSSGFPELDAHALDIIRRSPKWNPAIQYNQKVRFFQKQSLTYLAYEE